MFKTLLATVLAFFAFAAFAVDVNKATQAELEAVKGIGPVISAKILDERKKGVFKDWKDMVDRVKGVGEGNAAKFSAEGLTVNGGGFKGAAAAPAAVAKKDDKPMAKTAPTAATPAATPAATSAAPAAKAEMKKDDKPAAAAAPAEDKKAMAKKEKEDKKAAAMKAKEDKKAAKAMAADAKASDAKPSKK